VYVCERERERECVTAVLFFTVLNHFLYIVCVFERESERKKERERERERERIRERERVGESERARE